MFEAYHDTRGQPPEPFQPRYRLYDSVQLSATVLQLHGRLHAPKRRTISMIHMVPHGHEWHQIFPTIVNYIKSGLRGKPSSAY